MRTLILVVRVQLPLGWNTYLLFNSNIVNFVWKTDEGEAESIVLLVFVQKLRTSLVYYHFYSQQPRR